MALLPVPPAPNGGQPINHDTWLAQHPELQPIACSALGNMTKGSAEYNCVATNAARETARNLAWAAASAQYNYAACVRGWTMDVNASGGQAAIGTRPDLDPHYCDSYLTPASQGGAVQTTPLSAPLAPPATTPTSIIAAIPPPKPVVTAQPGSAPVSATLHPPQPTAGPASQPGKVSTTVEPGSVPTAQREGTGTLLAGPKDVSSYAGAAGPSVATPSSGGAGTSAGSSAFISDLFAGMGFWLQKPTQAARDIQPALSGLGDPNQRGYAAGILALPIIAAYVIYKAIK